MPGLVALRLLAAMLLTLAAVPAAAQLPLPAAEETAAAPIDRFGRETPRSTVTALIRALAERDYVLAGKYFALGHADPARGAMLARAFQASLDASGELVPFAGLSNDPLGAIEDGLPPELERVGVLGEEGGVPILLARTEVDGAAEPESEAEGEPPVWQISDATVAALDEQIEQLPQADPAGDAFVIAGAPVTDWAILLGLFVAVFFGFRLLSGSVLWGLRWLLARPERSGIYRFLNAALPPFSLLLAVIVFRIWGSVAPVGIVARQVVLRYTGIIAWVALAWFAVRLVDAVAATLTSRMEGAERRQAVSVITLARRAAKFLLVAIALVAILDTLGIDVTTGIAALGIGGLALALGAQKTVENLVGSVTVVADRPIQVGDFCRVGDVLGTVEDIGMRSTRIRTLDRTVVTIPNGDFCSRQIENYARRDRFLFNPVIGLEYGISADQLRKGVAIIENVLIEHPQVAEDSRRVKLRDFGASSLHIEVFAYIDVTDFVESLGIRQQLLLAIFERLEKAGLAIAFPTQTVYLRPDREAAESGPG